LEKKNGLKITEVRFVRHPNLRKREYRNSSGTRSPERKERAKNINSSKKKIHLKKKKGSGKLVHREFTRKCHLKREERI